MWRSVIDQPQDLIMYKADLNSLLTSVEWDEALRDLNTWTYFSSKFKSFLKESIPMSVQKRKKNLCVIHEARSLKNRETLCGKIHKIQSHSDHLAYT